MKDSVEVSIIVPTFDEAENIVDLLVQLKSVLSEENYEILVVDDNSPDGTWRHVEEFQAGMPPDGRVGMLRRLKEKGLSSAVVDGFNAARGCYLGVIDADLSHDVQILPSLIASVRNGADMAVGSRRVPGGGADKWPWHRRLFSEVATRFSRFLLGFRIHDPMSGYFVVKRDLFEAARLRLRPKGYKILLEVLLKSRVNQVVEIPYLFKDRKQGYSKLSSKVMVSYLAQVLELFLDRNIQRLRHFWHTSRYKKISKLMQPGSLLDLGCGQPCESMPDGAFLQYVGRGFGIDLKRCFGPLPFVQGDIAHLPFRSGSIDNVVAMEVLEHVQDPDAVLREIHRVLTDRGIFVMSVPRETWVWERLWSIWERYFGKLWRGTHVSEVEHDAWPGLLQKHFRMEASGTHLHFLMIFKATK